MWILKWHEKKPLKFCYCSHHQPLQFKKSKVKKIFVDPAQHYITAYYSWTNTLPHRLRTLGQTQPQLSAPKRFPGLRLNPFLPLANNTRTAALKETLPGTTNRFSWDLPLEILSPSDFSLYRLTEGLGRKPGQTAARTPTPLSPLPALPPALGTVQPSPAEAPARSQTHVVQQPKVTRTAGTRMTPPLEALPTAERPRAGSGSPAAKRPRGLRSPGTRSSAASLPRARRSMSSPARHR